MGKQTQAGPARRGRVCIKSVRKMVRSRNTLVVLSSHPHTVASLYYERLPPASACLFSRSWESNLVMIHFLTKYVLNTWWTASVSCYKRQIFPIKDLINFLMLSSIRLVYNALITFTPHPSLIPLRLKPTPFSCRVAPCSNLSFFRPSTKNHSCCAQDCDGHITSRREPLHSSSSFGFHNPTMPLPWYSLEKGNTADPFEATQ